MIAFYKNVNLFFTDNNLNRLIQITYYKLLLLLLLQGLLWLHQGRFSLGPLQNKMRTGWSDGRLVGLALKSCMHEENMAQTLGLLCTHQERQLLALLELWCLRHGLLLGLLLLLLLQFVGPQADYTIKLHFSFIFSASLLQYTNYTRTIIRLVKIILIIILSTKILKLTPVHNYQALKFVNQTYRT